MIKGIQKTSLIDYPGKICTILFTSDCNMRCPFCQNPDLINKKDLPDLNEEKIFEFLQERKKWIDGVCITGGEPLIHKKVIDLIKKIKELNLLVKLDTNGLNPTLLKEIIDANLVDYIAMDIKSDKENYEKASGIKIDIKKIEESVQLIMNSDIDYEFRSTIVPDFFNKDIVKNIGIWLKGAKMYYLQQFRSTVPLLDKTFEGKKPLETSVLNDFKDILKEYIDEVKVRD